MSSAQNRYNTFNYEVISPRGQALCSRLAGSAMKPPCAFILERSLVFVCVCVCMWMCYDSPDIWHDRTTQFASEDLPPGNKHRARRWCKACLGPRMVSHAWRCWWHPRIGWHKPNQWPPVAATSTTLQRRVKHMWLH